MPKAMIKLGDIVSLIGPQQHVRVCEDVKGKEIELFVGKAADLRMSDEKEHKRLLDRYAKLMLIAANLNNNSDDDQDKAAGVGEASKKEPPFSLKIYIF